MVIEEAAVPHQKIYLPEPEYATKDTADDAGLWKPKGLMIQWGPYGEQDGAPAVGIGTGDFGETDEDMERINSGKGTLQDMMMLWFSRSQVNEAIRALRRARTAAYGADE